MIHARLSPELARRLARNLNAMAEAVEQGQPRRAYAYIHTSTLNHSREWLSLRIETGMDRPAWDRPR